jgi:thiol-disulfide isomerase/thioredoxin
MRAALIPVLLCALYGAAPAARAVTLGDIAPDWSLQTAGGSRVEFYDDAGDAVSVVIFWATWCPYCRRLMPRLQMIADEFRDRAVKFYALDIWDDGDPVAYMQRHSYTFRLLLNADDVADAYGVRATPGLYLIDRARRVIYKRYSGDADAGVERDLRDALGQALDPGRTAPAR